MGGSALVQALTAVEARLLNVEGYRKAVAGRGKGWRSPASSAPEPGSADALLSYDVDALPCPLLRTTTAQAEALSLAALVRAATPPPPPPRVQPRPEPRLACAPLPPHARRC